MGTRASGESSNPEEHGGVFSGPRVRSHSAPPGAGPAAGLREGAGLRSGSHPSLHQCPAVAAPGLSRVPGGSVNWVSVPVVRCVTGSLVLGLWVIFLDVSLLLCTFQIPLILKA